MDIDLLKPEPVKRDNSVDPCIPAPAKGQNGPLAIPVFREEVTLNVPTGEYEFAASMERDAAPAGGRLKFHVTNEKQLPCIRQAVTLFGVDTRIEGWLSDHGVPCKPFSHSDTKRREVILVGDGSDIRSDTAAWRELARRMAQGSAAIFISPDSFRRASANNLGNIDVVSDNPAAAVGYSLRTFAADNVSEEDRPSFNSEFYGRFSIFFSDLPGQRYRVELGMCEGWDFCNQPGMRVFDVFINDEMVLEKFDIVKETGKPMRAVFREFDVGPMNGKITIKFVNHINAASVSRVRLFDERGNMVLHLDARTHKQDGTRWLPLAEKTQFSYFDDWLYHKECVAKNHPIFDGLGPRGIMDWEYYGPVISRMVLEKPDGAANIVAAAFALGDYCSATGYASGVMIAEYAFGSGRFLLNTFNILENVGNHPSADRLILNLLQYAATLCEEPPVPLPADFDVKLKEIDYV